MDFDAERLKNLGNAQKKAGDVESAIGSYRRSLELSPDYLPALYNLGLTLHETQRLEEAERCFGKIGELDPGDADALFHLGVLQAGRSDLAAAVKTFCRALQTAPENAYLWMHLGLAYKDLGNFGDAGDALRRAMRLQPDLAQPWLTLGNLLMEHGRLQEATAQFAQAIAAFPGFAPVHNGMGCALTHAGSLEEALNCFLAAIRLDPEFADAHLNAGNVHTLRGDHARAIPCYAEARRLEPENPQYVECLLLAMQQVCDWSRFDELCARRRRDVLEVPQRSTVPFGLLSIPSTPGEQRACAAALANRLRERVARNREELNFSFVRSPRTRLKIGYLSADFHEHVTAQVMTEVFELHDKDQFEFVAYSYGPDDASLARARLVKAFHRFVDIRSLSYRDAAAAIHADHIDILVDLKGYTQHARTEITALRPAPIQVNYLGFPATMGADFVDYIIADRFVLRAGDAAQYSEQPVYLPGCYYARDRKRPVADMPARPALGLPERAFVFCCFNQTFKILPDVFGTWMRLLAAVPDSVLWLLEGTPLATENLRLEAGRRGISADRLIFAPRVPTDRYLGQLRAADLFLDTRPYNAHTTANDALWVGVPVITCPGDTFASRVAGSQLNAIGLPELVTGSMGEYERLALRLAREPACLESLRQKLQQNRATAMLFDTGRYTRDLESAYLRMWANFLTGVGPAPIEFQR
jgi:predicted O-linked N-acetylglucosamine transferase (SPINDLY family)